MTKYKKKLLIMLVFTTVNILKAQVYYTNGVADTVGQNDFKAVKKDDVLIGAYWGFPYFEAITASTFLEDSASNLGIKVIDEKNINHIGISVESMATENFGVGLEYTYSSYWVSYRYLSSSIVHTLGLRKQRILIKLNYHFETSEKLDFYINGGVGYRITKIYTSDTRTVDEELVLPKIPLSVRGAAGFRYYVTPKVSITTEVGIGGPLVQFGATYRIYK